MVARLISACTDDAEALADFKGRMTAAFQDGGLLSLETMP